MLTERQDTMDRALVGGTAAVWLAFVGVAVAAIVALVNLASARDEAAAAAESQTPWGLYLVIIVSALIIIGAIALLYRARNTALTTSAAKPAEAESASSPQPAPAPSRPVDLPTEKLRVFGSVAELFSRTSTDQSSRSAGGPGGLPARALDRIWLRASVGLAGAMGLASLAVATATYFMASDSGTAAWVALGIAAVVTALMPVIPWQVLRQLRAMLASQDILDSRQRARS